MLQVDEVELENERDEERREVDRKLRAVVRQREALSFEEAELIGYAEEIQVWRAFDCGSFMEYLERVGLYSPRAASERARVAKALRGLPLIRDEYERGDISYSTVRELTRRATRDTEAEWLEAAHERNARELEELVADHEYGDRPSSAINPDRFVTLTLKVRRSTAAVYRRTHVGLDDETGEKLSEDQVLLALCGRAFAPAENQVTPPAFTIGITTCRACHESRTAGGGITPQVSKALIAQAACDARHLGDLEQEQPSRVVTTVTKKMREYIFIRDHFKCCVPTCRATRFLNIHHLEHQCMGGKHVASNLALLCFGHHQRLHEGKLRITGTAPRGLTFEGDLDPFDDDFDPAPGAFTHVGKWPDARSLRCQPELTPRTRPHRHPLDALRGLDAPNDEPFGASSDPPNG